MEDSWVVDAGLSGDATLGVDPRSGKGVGCDFGVEEGDRDELIKPGDLRCWSSRQRGEASGDALVGLEDVSVGITGVVTVLQPSVIRFFRVVTGWELWVICPDTDPLVLYEDWLRRTARSGISKFQCTKIQVTQDLKTASSGLRPCCKVALGLR